MSHATPYRSNDTLYRGVSFMDKDLENQAFVYHDSTLFIYIFPTYRVFPVASLIVWQAALRRAKVELEQAVRL